MDNINSANVNNTGNDVLINNLTRTNHAANAHKDKPKKAKDLGKDEFLKILVTQLSHQDPLQPLQDKDFIAQMAQFSSLEQMMQINNNISKINKTSDLNNAFFFLGKNVKVLDKATQQMVTGKVQEVDLTNPGAPGLKINNRTYNLDQVIGIVTAEGNNLNSDKLVEDNK